LSEINRTTGLLIIGKRVQLVCVEVFRFQFVQMMQNLFSAFSKVKIMSKNSSLLVGTIGVLGIGVFRHFEEGNLPKFLSFPLIHAATPRPVLKASCDIMPEPLEALVMGRIDFVQKNPEVVQITATIWHLSKGYHGIHIHEKGDFSQGCFSCGDHYNPFNQEHGGPKDKIRHVGDLGNIYSNGDRAKPSILKLELEDNLIKFDGPTSVMGRSVVIHSLKDDLGKLGYVDSKTTGHCGLRVGCGLIRPPYKKIKKEDDPTFPELQELLWTLK